MLTTTNYGLKKPEGTDVVNIDDFNGNADIIDTKLKEINSALPLKAPLDSPGLTGAPTAPTQTPGDNSTKIANTAFVTIAIANKTSVSGNAGTATKLQTPRNIALAGDVTGSANFDGSGNISITTTVADDSHNHIIANVDGLQSALDVIDTHLSDLANKKIDKSSIVNNLTATIAGFVLDATQGKVLQDEISTLQNYNYLTTSIQNTAIDVATGTTVQVKFDSATNSFVDISNSTGNITFKQTGIYLILAKMSVWNMLAGNVVTFNFGEDGSTRHILATPIDFASLYSKLDIQKLYNITTAGTTTSIWTSNNSSATKSVHLSTITIIKLK
ncbi:hypothetical protein CBE01nite_35690 [Clostridium beijerinckii]|uniref:Uncharacterized protein n=1 Tax=Clostridium beijerinckii TaxID=1520 RepID=A0AB74VQ39_CLOBE|nr:hypothetical protein [Clostridium beijerinckii]NRZ25179.1 hypothetical protein [Clostridium beijerinckii]NYB99893.1 hypothetical protein [Clostridium beijerinckii]OOM26456.1 hypothetical protein CLBEI_10500 [Clostridium beijerinckii]QUN37916.1 hypothetical protein KEC93_03805 [Clostridium beijerinckii]SQB13350.1 Uncharacterised protein [Clostridium beijerinckii]